MPGAFSRRWLSIPESASKPIIACSIVAVAIIIERFWSLHRKRITPQHLVAQVWHWAKANDLDEVKVNQLRMVRR